MAEYRSFAGFVQFEVDTHEANGKTLRRAVIEPFNTKKRVRVTLWPELDSVEVQKGDILFAEGKYETRINSKGNEEFNLSAVRAHTLSATQSSPPKVVSKKQPVVADDDDWA